MMQQCMLTMQHNNVTKRMHEPKITKGILGPTCIAHAWDQTRNAILTSKPRLKIKTNQ